MRYICQIVILLFILSACSGKSGRERMLQIVEEWQGKEIVVPDVMTDFLTGDTIDLSDADFTILTYIDSTGCIDCRMRLPLWNEFLSSLDSICDSDVRFLMLVCTSNTKDLNYYLKSDGFSYPVYLDGSNTVAENNSFPEETAVQTFLLDRNKNVAAIGNPVYSPEISKLFKRIISGQRTVSAESSGFVSVNENRISLGNFRPGEVASREIIFSNHSNDTVYIRKVISSCDCADLSLPKEHITPRSDLKAVLQVKGDTVPGDFERTIHVYYSDFEYPTVITVNGNIFNNHSAGPLQMSGETKQKAK